MNGEKYREGYNYYLPQGLGAEEAVYKYLKKYGDPIMKWAYRTRGYRGDICVSWVGEVKLDNRCDGGDDPTGNVWLDGWNEWGPDSLFTSKADVWLVVVKGPKRYQLISAPLCELRAWAHNQKTKQGGNGNKNTGILIPKKVFLSLDGARVETDDLDMSEAAQTPYPGIKE